MQAGALGGRRAHLDQPGRPSSRGADRIGAWTTRYNVNATIHSDPATVHDTMDAEGATAGASTRVAAASVSTGRR